MKQKPELKLSDSDITTAIADAAESMDYPSELIRRLDSLEDPDISNSESLIGGRSRYLLVAAATILALCLSALWLSSAGKLNGEVQVATPNTAEPNSIEKTVTSSDKMPASTTEAELLPTLATTFNPNSPSDDPNPIFDGVFGRSPVSENRVPRDYPTPSSTGIESKLDDLTISTGFEVVEDGAVIDGMDIEGSLEISANNVVIQNSRITSDGLWTVKLNQGFNGLTLKDSRIRSVGPDASSALQIEGSATLQRLHITGGITNITSLASLTLEDSYLAGSYRNSPDGGSSNLQVNAGEGIVIRGNSMLGPWKNANASLVIQPFSGYITNVLVEDNYLSGGGYSVYTVEDEFALDGVIVKDNCFEVESWLYGWKNNNAGAIYEGNHQSDSIGECKKENILE